MSASTNVIYTDSLGDVLEVTKREEGLSSIGIRAKRAGWSSIVSIKDEDVEKVLSDMAKEFGYILMKAEKANGEGHEE